MNAGVPNDAYRKFLSRREGSIAITVKDDYSSHSSPFTSSSKCNLASNQSYQELERVMGEMILLICSLGI
jgi:hypothetical protein